MEQAIGKGGAISHDVRVHFTGKKVEKVTSATMTTKKHLVKRERPRALQGWTYQMQTGCGPLYVTVNEDKNGLLELFTTMGKAGGCASSQSEAIGRMVSLAWRSGIQASQVVKQLLGISCHCQTGFGDNKVLSCADAVAKAIQVHMKAKGYDTGLEMHSPTMKTGACPDCGDTTVHERMRFVPCVRVQ
jgi:ribonucleoside-diphosphate reductase alpha chain